jgi:hypothetical protein
MMHPNTDSKIQEFIDDIKRKVLYFEKELDYARQSSWGSFSKGRY